MNFLDKIAAEKRGFFRFNRRSLVESILSAGDMAVISEIKRRSPSMGLIREVDAVKAAREMERAGAAAISVLTEGRYFGGSLRDLSDVKRSVRIPVLRKDFIVDERELHESRLYGADAVLLIASILNGKTKRFVDVAHDIGLECLVEVHGRSDLEYALESKARMIAINSRDLRTLKVDIKVFGRLAPLVPEGRIIVAESGVRSRLEVAAAKKVGAKAVLVGTSVMESDSINEKVRELVEG